MSAAKIIQFKHPETDLLQVVARDSAPNAQTEGLKREIGVAGVFTNVVNNTIGGGIFLLPAIIAGVLGNASILAYIACGVLFMLVMLCYVEVSSQVTGSGGTYAYIEAAFGPYAGFISNTLFWFGTGVFVTAALLNGVADILSVAFPVLLVPVYRAILFVLVLGLFTYINIRGVKQGMMLVKIITLMKFIPIILLITLGIWGSKSSNLRWEHFPSFNSLGKVALILFFSFAGGESALNISGEMKNPKRTGPLGLLLGTVATIIIFCGIQLVAQGVLGSQLADFKSAPLAEVAGRLMGPWGFTLIVTGSVIAILGILNSLPMVFSRVMFAGANKGLLPEYLGKIHPRFATPSNAILSFSAIAFVVAVSGGFRHLAVIVSATLLLLYVGVVVATVKFLAIKKVEEGKAFRNPGGLAVPIAALLALLWFIIQLELKAIIGLGIFIGFLSAIYYLKKLQEKGWVKKFLRKYNKSELVVPKLTSMKKIFLPMLLWVFVNACNQPANPAESTVADNTASKVEINALLDSFNRAAAKADYNSYFNFYGDDAIFTGTDATERWDKKAFMVWAKPYFDKGKAWDFTTLDRHVYFDKTGNTAWFDELLNTQMKLCRGSGVLVKQRDGWKIQQYILSTTVPNDSIDSVIKIKANVEDSLIRQLSAK